MAVSSQSFYPNRHILFLLVVSTLPFACDAADFLFRLLVTRDLKRYACYLNLEAGSQRSLYVTDEALGKYL